MPCVVLTINLFSIQEIGHPKWRVALGFRQGLFEGFFRTPGSLRSQTAGSLSTWRRLPVDLSPLVLRALAWKVHDLRQLYNLVYTLHAVIHHDLKDRTGSWPS